jgi:hypothetical protein
MGSGMKHKRIERRGGGDNEEGRRKEEEEEGGRGESFFASNQCFQMDIREEGDGGELDLANS